MNSLFNVQKSIFSQIAGPFADEKLGNPTLNEEKMPGLIVSENLNEETSQI